MAERPELLDIRGVAEVLNVSTSTVKALVRDGHLPQGRKVYRSTRWHRSTVDALLERLRREDISEAPKGAEGRGRAKSPQPLKDA